jgi:hypothetical protein
MFTKTLIIFIGLFLNQTNQSDMISQIANKTNDESIKVIVNMPDQILQGQPCEIKVEIKNISAASVLINKRLSIGYQNSLSRELFIIICKKNTSKNIGLQKVLYNRNFSSESDFVWLLPQQQTSTHFNLFDWYDIPSAGTYTIRVCYQTDEELAYKPEGLLKGEFCSEEKTLTVFSE